MYDGSAVQRRDIPPRVTLEPRSERGAIVQAAGWQAMDVALMPTGRLQSYRETYADPYGVFRISGIPPGRYVLTAWLDDPPCAIYNEAELEQCRASGARVDVAPGSRASLVLNVKAVAGR